MIGVKPPTAILIEPVHIIVVGGEMSAWPVWWLMTASFFAHVHNVGIFLCASYSCS